MFQNGYFNTIVLSYARKAGKLHYMAQAGSVLQLKEGYEYYDKQLN